MLFFHCPLIKTLYDIFKIKFQHKNILLYILLSEKNNESKI